MKQHLLLFILAISCSLQLQAQCPPSETAVKLEIQTDQFFNEVNWAIKNKDGSVEYVNQTAVGTALETHEYCIPDTNCLLFRLTDAASDGMPGGFFKLYVDGVLVHEGGGDFSSFVNVNFNCGPGEACTSRVPVALGEHAAGDETWYAFTPADTGAYFLTTCLPGNSCGTKIWVYDHCGPTYDNNLGTVFYAENGCGDSTASMTLYLAGGKEYVLRIGDHNTGCVDSIAWSLAFEGPIAGCSDPNACNYQPLATTPDACIYPGDPACPNYPDLLMRQDILISSISLGTYNNTDACTIQEGCLTGMGIRYLVNFDTRIDNIGNQDYYIGAPPTVPGTPSSQFIFDPCHQHWHYAGYAEYLLFDQNGVSLPVGFKNGFCVIDLDCSQGGQQKYTCENMGMSYGCADIYSAGLPCQWIDVTSVPEGDYTFVTRVNWDKTPDSAGRIESDFSNNWAQACLRITRDAMGVPSLEILTDCPQFTDCLGELLGSAQPDCKGVCNGPALRGDLNEDNQRNTADVALYMDAAIDPATAATECADLFDDNAIDVYDAALLLECELHENDPMHWFGRFPCRFPTGLENTQDLMFLLPGSLDEVNKTFDVEIVNPYHGVLGYQFSVTGMVISSVENLYPGYNGWLDFNANGEIMALSLSENKIAKNVLPAAFLRIHYSELTAAEVCIGAIQAVVNDQYNKAAASVTTENCAMSSATPVSEVPGGKFGVFAYPNPAQEEITLFFPNPNEEPVQVTLTCLDGRVLRNYENLRSESVTLSRNGLPQGVYFYSVKSALGAVSGKVVFE